MTNFDAPPNLDPAKAYAVVVRHHSEVANLALTLAFSPDELALHLELHESKGWDCSVFYAPGVDLPPVIT